MTTARTMIPALDDSVRVHGQTVHILDRRVFPETLSWVVSESAEDVARAIREMVTQSSGPLFAAYAGMEITALQVAGLKLAQAQTRMQQAGAALASARPTNNHPREAVDHVLGAVQSARSTGELVDRAVEAAQSGPVAYRARSYALGRETAALLADGSRILTHCWMDSYLIELVRAATDAGKSFEWVATETRPYLQGARLTAHTLAELGQSVTLITDGMGAAALSPGSSIGPIDALVTAADRVSLDGSVVNKVGTLGLAIAATAFDVPFYALVQAPDENAPTADDIVIEQRDPAEVLHTLGRRTASGLVTEAWYPAFDVTPGRFVSKIITDRGAFAPSDVHRYWSDARGRARPNSAV
ncbi:translation initiation factor eIF-2B alpha/beta/delta subunit family protein [Subtercola frigoramans]|uniref:Methylthioribose-1-phosphate isomerase n=1 Tax=Subtercola frigoramans TaxID=120298 RepID=A0ABS2L2S5_9MICO|nr:hypothetical protein [Subtercola frigoramans]MBM7471367.1 methylthioribose-1-phosphate isomerase [Subtercola frigoramans]